MSTAWQAAHALECYFRQEKRCGQCRKTKPFSAFQKRAESADGLQAACRDCMNAYNAHARARKHCRLILGLKAA